MKERKRGPFYGTPSIDQDSMAMATTMMMLNAVDNNDNQEEEKKERNNH